MVPTVDRGLRLAAFWSIETAGDSPSMKSTSGLSICPRNCRAYADSDSTYRRWPSAKMVSNARLDLPEPDSPVNTIRESLGRSSERSLRLCSRAPRTTRRSATALCSLDGSGRGQGDTSWYLGALTKPVSAVPGPALGSYHQPRSSACHAVRKDWPRCPKGVAHERGQSFPGSAGGGDRAPARNGHRPQRRPGARTLVAARLEPGARAYPRRPQRGRDDQPAALGANRDADPDVRQRREPRCRHRG